VINRKGSEEFTQRKKKEILTLLATGIAINFIFAELPAKINTLYV